MAKNIQVTIMNGTVPVKTIEAMLVNKKLVCYEKKMWNVRKEEDGKWYLDLYDMNDFPWDPQPIDPELERLFTWFIRDNKNIAAVTMDKQYLVVTEKGFYGPDIPRKGNANLLALTLPFLTMGAMGGLR